MTCPQCGSTNLDNNYKCTRCSALLHGTIAPVVITSDENMGGLMPLKNPSALVAYYLGIFSIIPGLGVLLGIAAVILGLKGLRNVRANPAVKGKIHAWVGIVGGATFSFLYLFLIGIFVFNTRS